MQKAYQPYTNNAKGRLNSGRYVQRTFSEGKNEIYATGEEVQYHLEDSEYISNISLKQCLSRFKTSVLAGYNTLKIRPPISQVIATTLRQK